MDEALEREFRDVLHQVISGTISREQYFKAFQTVHRASSTNESVDRACCIVHSVLRDHVCEGIRKRLNRSSDVTFLISLRDEWRKFRIIMTALRDLFRHLDAQIDFMKPRRFKNTENIKAIAPCVWRDHVLDPFRHEITSRLIGIINEDRKGKPVLSDEDLRTVIEAIASLDGVEGNDVRIYESYRNAYLADLEAYFWINLPKPTYCYFLAKVKRFIAEELQRTRRFFRHDDELVLETVHRLILANNPRFLSRMVEATVINADYEKLRELYSVLRPMNEPGVQLMHAAIKYAFGHPVKQNFGCYLDGATDSTTSFVYTISRVEEDLREMVQVAFDNDPAFELLCIEVCKNTVSPLEDYCGDTAANLVALYYNRILDSVTNEDVGILDRRFKLALTAAKYVTSASDFHTTYLDLLRKRLLKSRWCRVKVEKQAVDSLEKALGSEYTSRLPAVLKDVFDSRLVNQLCQGFPSSSAISFKNFEATTLAQEHWFFEKPLSPLVKLPVAIENNMRIYAHIYREKLKQARQNSSADWVPRRNLIWYHNMAQVEILTSFSGRPYLIKCTGYIAVILLAFEEVDSRSVQSILEETNLSELDLDAALTQLERIKILIRADGAGELALNRNFKNAGDVVDLLEPTVKKEIRTLVEKAKNPIDQQCYTEALIIRILKKHHQLWHDALLKEIMATATRAKLDIDEKLVFKCLASLEDKLYIETRGSIYVYLP